MHGQQNVKDMGRSLNIYGGGKSEGHTQFGKRCHIGDYNIKWNLKKSNGK